MSGKNNIKIVLTMMNVMKMMDLMILSPKKTVPLLFTRLTWVDAVLQLALIIERNWDRW
jgi:hypothetical protein